jgi:hypothetical protein
MWVNGQEMTEYLPTIWEPDLTRPPSQLLCMKEKITDYQWEGEGEELQSLLVGKCRKGLTELISKTVQERSYRKYQWEG